MVVWQLRFGDAMKTESIISTFYPEIGESIGFAHPNSGLTYTMLSKSQLIHLANQAVTRLIRMGIDQVLVAESGAAPFAKICARLAYEKNLTLRWYSIKIPRNIRESFNVTLQAYLSLSQSELKLSHEFDKIPNSYSFNSNPLAKYLPEYYFYSEQLSLQDILQTLGENIDFPGRNHYLDMTQSTGLAQIVQQPFIFFDEYIDSGKTLFQSFRFFKLFAKSLKFKVFSYLVKLHQSEINQNVCESLYTLDNEYLAYQRGVYPFENRIDWLGYYYISTPFAFQKICIADLCSKNNNVPNDTKPLQSGQLLSFINELDLVDLLKDVKLHCDLAEISAWINYNHLMQYSLYKIEEIHIGKNQFSEFLYQLFDMYGPIWSPLPDQYHVCYLNAFEKTNDKIKLILTNRLIGSEYKKCRHVFMQQITQLFETRRIRNYKLINHIGAR